MFKAGDEVICIENFDKSNMLTGKREFNSPYPVKGEHYIIDRIFMGHLVLKGFPEKIAYDSKKFRKLSDIWSEEILENIIEQAEKEELVLVNN